MTDLATNKYILRKKLEMLEDIKGRHTELISLYIPDGYEINKASQQIRNEIGTASNIKDKNTRKNVLSALESIDRYLKHFKVTPQNGLILFCGDASEKEGDSDIQLWDIIPPEPISVRLYRCDQEFVLDPLKELIEEKEVVGLLVMDKKEATIGFLNGKRIEVVTNMTSGYHGKFRGGGQSSRRFDRLLEISAHEFYVRIAETMNQSFLDKKDFKGIIIGGPGPTKNEFIDGGHLHHELQKKILGVYDAGYTNESGLKELVNLALTKLEDLAVSQEKEILQRFLKEVSTEGLAVYGKNEVMKALKMGAIDKLIISEEIDYNIVAIKCGACSHEEKRTVKNFKAFKKEVNDMQCPKCSEKMMKIIEIKDFVEECDDLSKEVGTDIEMVSAETEEGNQFLKSFGGFGGLLRFKISE